MNCRKVFPYVYSFGNDKPHRQYFFEDYEYMCYYILDSRSASGILCEVNINKMDYYDI